MVVHPVVREQCYFVTCGMLHAALRRADLALTASAALAVLRFAAADIRSINA